MARHRHADLIHAWAEGATIQYFSTTNGDWTDIKCPSWYEEEEYRIKPAKREGWIRVYKEHPEDERVRCGYIVYPTKQALFDHLNESGCAREIVAAVKIEWEEPN